jgi:hypothetical protein
MFLTYRDRLRSWFESFDRVVDEFLAGDFVESSISRSKDSDAPGLLRIDAELALEVPDAGASWLEQADAGAGLVASHRRSHRRAPARWTPAQRGRTPAQRGRTPARRPGAVRLAPMVCLSPLPPAPPCPAGRGETPQLAPPGSS